MKTFVSFCHILTLAAAALSSCLNLGAQTRDYPIDSMAVNGQAADGQGMLQFIARLLPPHGDEDKLPDIYTMAMSTKINVTPNGFTQVTQFSADVKSGKLKELFIDVAGKADLTDVRGDNIESWSQKKIADSQATQLVIQLKEPIESGGISFSVSHEQAWDKLPFSAEPITFNLADPRLFHGQLRIESDPTVELSDWNLTGLIAIDPSIGQDEKIHRYITDAAPYSLAFSVVPSANAPTRFTDFQLIGQWQTNAIEFKLSGEIVVDDPNGADMLLLSGNAAFVKLPEINHGHITYRNGAYRFTCDRAGRFPIEGVFLANINKQPGKRLVDFGIAASALRPVQLVGIPTTLNRIELGGSPVESRDDALIGFLSPTGGFKLQWTDPAWLEDPTQQAKLFYTAENHIDTTISVGLMRQSQNVQIDIVQGAMTSLKLWLDGQGEVTNVAGPAVLNWNIGQPDPTKNNQRAITVRFNRPQTDQTNVEVNLQTALGEFPVNIKPARLTTENAIRSGGFWSLRNAGAVELSPQSLQNLAQIAPEFLPSQSQREPANQLLAYRFAGDQYRMELQVDNILPEIAVSEIILYRLDENDQSITAELECDIRRAPVRDFRIALPSEFTLSQVDAPSLADYFINESSDGQNELRLVFSQPIDGKRIIKLSLERNAPLPGSSWSIPYLTPIDVKSVRGHIGVAAGPGLRLSINKLNGVAEQVTTYFPQRINDLRLALRLRQPDWSAELEVEKLSQSIQAESLHLITLAEGALYGSTIINYAIGDAPVDSFRIRIPSEYQNINFSGPNVRSWKVQEDGAYQIDLQRAMTGPYTLLVTYESKFPPQGALLSFGGVEPLAVESEQGYIVAASDFPFDISSIKQTPGLLMLEPNEIPAEFRLLFKSQVLAAYQYTRRPFELSLQIAPFEQGQTINQVVDYSELTTQISGDGESLTTAIYQLKSKGRAHFKISLPPQAELWSVRVADKKVTPTADGDSILIPLPAGSSADTAIPVRLQWASRATDARYPILEAPQLTSPALMINWQVSADTGYNLRYLGGSLQPIQQIKPSNAWSWLREVFFDHSWFMKLSLLACLTMVTLGLIAMTLLRQQRLYSKIGKAVAVLCILLSIGAGLMLLNFRTNQVAQVSRLDFTTPLEQSSAPLVIELSNLPGNVSSGGAIGWLGLGLGLTILAYCAWRVRQGSPIPLLEIAAWLSLLWGTLYMSISPVFFALLLFAAMVRYLYVPGRSFTRATSAATILTLGLFGILSPNHVDAKSIAPSKPLIVVTETNQRIIIDENVANVTATLTWDAEAHAVIPLLASPAVMQDIQLPEGVELRLDKAENAELYSKNSGKHLVTLSYRVPVNLETNQRSIDLPLCSALISRAEFIVPGENIVVNSNDAVSMTTETSDGQTQTDIVFRPTLKATLHWAPETRDVSKEKSVFFAESYEIYQPMAGIVEDAHQIAVRPAQGIVEQLRIATPDGLTITSVEAPKLNNWRFDPEKQIVELFFQPGHSTNFSINVRSQYTSQSLPYTQSVQPLSLPEASSQVSLIALATDSEVHIGEIKLNQNSAINLEDFPTQALALLKHPSNTPTIRRAYRWGGATSSLSFEALAVEPDTRVQDEYRLSYGEDRTLINAKLNVEVNRAGIFQLSFVVPENFDIESISSPFLSHWSETTAADGSRLVSMQLKQKLLGQTQFALTLSGPGLSNQDSLIAPRVLLRESNRQVGTALFSVEMGYRLTPTQRSMVTQLDPKDFGIRDAQAQYFRYLGDKAELQFSVDVIPPWIEVEHHQATSIRSGVIENQVRMEFTIENAGVRELNFKLPDDSLGVQFRGDAVDRFEPVEDEPGQWLVNLDRKRIGKFIIDIEYQRPTPQQPESETISGIKAIGVDQSKGTLSLITQGRLELSISKTPESLQIAESQMIPPKLRFPEQAQGVARIFRVLDPNFKLDVELIRRESANTLPAQVKSAQLLTVISDSGAVLTRMRIQLDPGDKRLLRLNLPDGSEFWYAYVNQQSAWPWREGDELILQLEASAVDPKDSMVEFFYSSKMPISGRKLNQSMVGPRLDLPMEDIEWEVYYPESWNIEEWNGNLTKESTEIRNRGLFNLTSYTANSIESAKQKTEEAKTMLAAGNELLESGRQEDARRAFEGAFNLSSNDAAFNSDARIQLQTLREQQAVVGLAQRRNMWTNANAQIPNMPQANIDLMNYRQQDAQQLLQANTIDDNASLREVAQELLQQQEAALVRPQALLTSIPEQGKSVRFLRSLQVDDQADLFVSFDGYRKHTDKFWGNLGTLVILAIFITFLAGTNRFIRNIA